MKKISEAQIKDLITRATNAKENAYAPYSKFEVGAAMLTENGKIYTGYNIENAVYRLGVCAEQVAISNAFQDGHKGVKFTAIAIVADMEGPCPPCGACRQTFIEFNDELMVIMANIKGEREIKSAKELLPFSFSDSTAKLK